MMQIGEIKLLMLPNCRPLEIEPLAADMLGTTSMSLYLMWTENELQETSPS